ncbi:unnamed protein product [Prorocentrum cordatum]|uniref:Uncharacterized protein n=1 Tax=Prorocentrum cordatum TaxID=2364126 RepID=A0ABN9VB65_9DINO|nr:unnamed protein product [Polarella glacialis]
MGRHRSGAGKAVPAEAEDTDGVPVRYGEEVGENSLVVEVVDFLSDGSKEMQIVSSHFAVRFNHVVRNAPNSQYNPNKKNDGSFKKWLVNWGFEVNPTYDRNKSMVSIPRSGLPSWTAKLLKPAKAKAKAKAKEQAKKKEEDLAKSPHVAKEEEVDDDPYIPEEPTSSAGPFKPLHGKDTEEALALEAEALSYIRERGPVDIGALRSVEDLGTRFNKFFFRKQRVNDGSWKRWLGSMPDVEFITGELASGLGPVAGRSGVAAQLGSATMEVIGSLTALQLPPHEKKLAYLVSDAGRGSPGDALDAESQDAEARLDRLRHPWPQAISPVDAALLTLGRCGWRFEDEPVEFEIYCWSRPASGRLEGMLFTDGSAFVGQLSRDGEDFAIFALPHAAAGRLDLFVDCAGTELMPMLFDVAREAARWSGELHAVLADVVTMVCDNLEAQTREQQEEQQQEDAADVAGAADGAAPEEAPLPATGDRRGMVGMRAAPSHALQAAEVAAPGRPPQTLVVASVRCGACGTKYAHNLAGTCHGANTTTLRCQKARLSDGRHPGHRQCIAWVLLRLRGPAPEGSGWPGHGGRARSLAGKRRDAHALTRAELLSAYG